MKRASLLIFIFACKKWDFITKFVLCVCVCVCVYVYQDCFQLGIVSICDSVEAHILLNINDFKYKHSK